MLPFFFCLCVCVYNGPYLKIGKEDKADNHDYVLSEEHELLILFVNLNYFPRHLYSSTLSTSVEKISVTARNAQ